MNPKIDVDTKALNSKFATASPEQIVEWALSLQGKTLLTTNFGPYESVILHMVSQQKADVQILWVDSGYNTKPTYAYAEALIQRLNLNIDVFTPKVSAARRDAVMNGIPSIYDEAHEEFTQQFKLEPFARAMDYYQPEVWLTAIRKEQTEFRQSLDVVTVAGDGVIKVAPVFHLSEEEMDAYLAKHDLPNETDYYDPTKAESGRECGLHTTR